MHESTQRGLCRLLFVGLCVLPLFVILTWAAVIREPGHPTRCARQWGMALRLGVRIKQVDYPRPGVTRYAGVRLLDPESGRPLADLGRVEVTTTSGGIHAAVSEAEFQAAAMPLLRDAVVARLRDPATAALASVRVSAAEVRFVDKDIHHSLADVIAGYDAAREGSQAFLGFALANVPQASKAKMRIVRNRQTNPPTTALELHTGDTPLPCRLVDPIARLSDWIGDDSQFRGSFWTHETATGWDTEIKGQLLGIDLRQFTTDRFPHLLSGTADVTIHRAQLHDNKLVDAQGSLVAGPGQMGVSLVESLKRWLEMPHHELRRDQVGELTYEQLAVAMSLNAHGVVFEGRARGSEANVVITDQHGPLVVAPKRTQSVLALASALGSFPTTRRLVGVGPHTDWLLSVLPSADASAERQQLTSEPTTPPR